MSRIEEIAQWLQAAQHYRKNEPKWDWQFIADDLAYLLAEVQRLEARCQQLERAITEWKDRCAGMERVVEAARKFIPVAGPDGYSTSLALALDALDTTKETP